MTIKPTSNGNTEKFTGNWFEITGDTKDIKKIDSFLDSLKTSYNLESDFADISCGEYTVDFVIEDSGLTKASLLKDIRKCMTSH